MFIALSAAHSYESNLLPALTMSLSRFQSDDGTIRQQGLGTSFFYLGMCDNGFSVLAGLSSGIAVSRDIAIQNDDSLTMSIHSISLDRALNALRKGIDTDANAGAFLNFDIGAGYAFVHNARFTLAATAGVSMELSHYGNTDTVTIDADEKERYTSITLIALSAGAHLNAICHITPSFGLFAGISARRPLVENIHHQASYDDSADDDGDSITHTLSSKNRRISGGASLQFSLGACWTL